MRPTIDELRARLESLSPPPKKYPTLREMWGRFPHLTGGMNVVEWLHMKREQRAAETATESPLRGEKGGVDAADDLA